MTIKKYSALILRGLSTDTKPTTGILPDTMFIETDTSLFYFWDDMMSEWMEHHASAPNTSMVASLSVYRVGDMVTVRNNITGMHAFEVDDTGTGNASTAFNYAIQNMPTSTVVGTVTYKGRISVMAGAYQCKTLIDFDADALGYNGIELVGEGRGNTRLVFSPTAALTNAVRFRMSRPRIADLSIYGNSNVGNLLTVNATATAYWLGVIERVQFDGANYNAGSTESGLANYTPGQKGIIIDGSSGIAAKVYFWRIHGCFFRGLEMGVHLYDQQATSVNQSDNAFLNCRIAEKITASQQNLHNFWIQGDANNGDIGIWCTPQGTGVGSLINISNINIEMGRTADITAPITGGTSINVLDLPRLGAIGILQDAGTANIRTVNIVATSAPGGIIVNKAPHANYNAENLYSEKLSERVQTITGRYLPGYVDVTNASGILKGCIRENSAGTKLSLSNGVGRRYTTSTTINTPRFIYYTNTGLTGGASLIGRVHAPKISVRFLPGGTNPTASLRMFIGLWQTFADPVSSSDILNTPRAGVGLWLDTAVSNNYRVMHSSGAGASTKSDFDTPQAVTAGTVLRTMTTVNYDDTTPANTDYTVWIGGRAKTVTTNIPTANNFGFLIYFENLAAEDKHLSIYEIEMETRAVK
jgi:hypothetical protein